MSELTALRCRHCGCAGESCTLANGEKCDLAGEVCNAPRCLKAEAARLRREKGAQKSQGPARSFGELASWGWQRGAIVEYLELANGQRDHAEIMKLLHRRRDRRRRRRKAT